MSRAPLRFKEKDLLRVMRVAQKAGGGWGVDILMDGTIRLMPAQPITTSAQAPVEPEPLIPL